MITSVLLLSGLALSGLALDDPRIVVVERARAGDDQGALEATRELIGSEPEAARELGLRYLEGHLLDRLGRRTEAIESFAAVMSETPRLRSHARLRIALDQEVLGHPEVSAGLAATVLGSNPPRSLIPSATSLLTDALRRGGDCRLLSALSTRSFPERERRALALSRAECMEAAGDGQGAIEQLMALLRQKQTDLAALLAAQHLDRLTTPASTEVLELLGRTFHHHRQFERATDYLQALLSTQAVPRIRTTRDFEKRYHLARSHFWLSRFDVAARNYEALAASAVSPRHVAQSLYHRGRALELSGRWPQAIAAFGQSYGAEPSGGFAAAALLSAMRLEWLLEREDDALQLYGMLARLTGARSTRARAALFLAASDISRSRADRAATWLDDAVAASTDVRLEASYWRGRLEELHGDPEGAVDAYLEAIRRDYFHPLSQDAVNTLRRGRLQEAARARGRSQVSSARHVYDVWILLGPEDPLGAAAHRRFDSVARAANGGELPIPSTVVPVAEWPLWQGSLQGAEETLLGLGIWSEGAPAASRYFPLAEARMAVTAAVELGRAGRTRDALLIAEILRDRHQAKVPEPLQPKIFRELLYPYPYRYLIDRSSERYGTDPLLLAALIREESRFEPRAASAAAARGLTQFVLSTAQAIAEREGMGQVGPTDLEQPEIAIELGAAYLRDLAKDVGADRHWVIAAYNAGEPQSILWGRYCHSDDPAEYLTKVAFRETRAYLRKVLTSYAQYRDLYAG